MKHFFLDTNVVLDFLGQREPFVAPAANLFQQAEQKTVVLYISSLSFSHVLHLLRKPVGAVAARALLIDLTEIAAIVAVDSASVNAALRSDLADFEDAIQYFAAASVPAITHIVTRDPKGFGGAGLPAISPVEALQLLT